MWRRRQQYLDSPEQGSTFMEMLLAMYPQHKNRLNEYGDDYAPAVAIDSALDYIAAQMSSEEMTDGAVLERARAIGVREPGLGLGVLERVQEIDVALQDTLAHADEKIVGVVGTLTLSVAVWCGVDSLVRVNNGLFFDQLTAQQFSLAALTSWLSYRALQRLGYF